jgi:hypothetical protein
MKAIAMYMRGNADAKIPMNQPSTPPAIPTIHSKYFSIPFLLYYYSAKIHRKKSKYKPVNIPVIPALKKSKSFLTCPFT